MSTDAAHTPAASPVPPSLEDTANAIEAIGQDRHALAALALKTLARNVITAVEQADQATNVCRFLLKLEIIVTAEGQYQLLIYDRDTGIDANALARDIAAEVSVNDFGKRLRPIQLEMTDNGG